MILLKGGRIVDPANGRDAVGDLWIDQGRIVAPAAGASPHETHDLAGSIVMAGGIDIHSHIAGGNVNTARLLLPEHHKAHAPRPAATPLTTAGWSTFETGCHYAQMGYTTVIEPAMLPANALHAHLELADIPFIDKAGLVVLGNDRFLLDLLKRGEGANAIRDYVAHMVAATRALGVKVINAGSAAAFKANARTFDLDDEVPAYGVSSRQIVQALQDAVESLGIPHPLHVHCNNLGDPGNYKTAIATMQAAQGRRMHFAHMQFYGYGTEGKRGFSSAAALLAEEINRRPNVTVDVGQVMFGQTVTVSCDVMRQFTSRDQARPRKWVIWDGDSNGGGILAYRYSATSFYNAIQWATGLELFLLVKDPAQVYFTTDHPNGAPFTTYPDILALLMSRELRAQWIERMPKAAMAMTTLPSIAREYTLGEIATMTRAAPARLLGLAERGHLGVGAKADIAVYRDVADRARMFRSAQLVFKDGDLIFEDGKLGAYRFGKALTVAVPAEAAMRRRVDDHVMDSLGVSASLLHVPDRLLGGAEAFGEVPCLA